MSFWELQKNCGIQIIWRAFGNRFDTNLICHISDNNRKKKNVNWFYNIGSCVNKARIQKGNHLFWNTQFMHGWSLIIDYGWFKVTRKRVNGWKFTSGIKNIKFGFTLVWQHCKLGSLQSSMKKSQAYYSGGI